MEFEVWMIENFFLFVVLELLMSVEVWFGFCKLYFDVENYEWL